MPPSKTKTKKKPKEKTPVVDVKEDSSDEDSITLLELTKPRKDMPPESNAKDESTTSNTPDNDTFDVILPPLLGSGNAGECTVMIEVDPEDAALLDYEGISGAIGRFEADDRGGTLRSLGPSAFLWLALLVYGLMF
jgi:hypothetical protein